MSEATLLAGWRVFHDGETVLMKQGFIDQAAVLFAIVTCPIIVGLCDAFRLGYTVMAASVAMVLSLGLLARRRAIFRGPNVLMRLTMFGLPVPFTSISGEVTSLEVYRTLEHPEGEGVRLTLDTSVQVLLPTVRLPEELVMFLRSQGRTPGK